MRMLQMLVLPLIVSSLVTGKQRKNKTKYTPTHPLLNNFIKMHTSKSKKGTFYVLAVLYNLQKDIALLLLLQT